MNKTKRFEKLNVTKFAIVLSMLFVTGIIFFSNTIVSYADSGLNFPGATPKEGYKFEFEKTKDSVINVKPVETKDYFLTSCIHNNCTIHTGEQNCFVTHAAYYVYCKDCYDKYGAEVPLVTTGGKPRNVLYYPLYMNFANNPKPNGIDPTTGTCIGYGNYKISKYKEYLEDVASIAEANEENGGLNYSKNNKDLKVPLQVTNGDVYRFPCYSNDTCNQHVTWDHTHITEVPITYSVRYISNGGKGSMNNTVMTYDKATNLRKNTYTMNYYDFQGWALTSSDANKGIVTYKDGESVKNLTTVDGDVIDLYAVWKSKPVQLTVVPAGGIYNGSTEPSVTSGLYPNDTVILNNPTHNDANKHFVTWSVVQGDATVENGTVTMGRIDSVVIASWNGPLSLTATANWNTPENGGKGAVDLAWTDNDFLSYQQPYYKPHEHTDECYNIAVVFSPCGGILQSKKVVTGYYDGTLTWDAENGKWVRKTCSICGSTTGCQEVKYEIHYECSTCGKVYKINPPEKDASGNRYCTEQIASDANPHEHVDSTGKNGCYEMKSTVTNTGNGSIETLSCGCQSQKHYWKCSKCGKTWDTITRNDNNNQCNEHNDSWDDTSRKPSTCTDSNVHKKKVLKCTIPATQPVSLVCGYNAGDPEKDANGNYIVEGKTASVNYNLYGQESGYMDFPIICTYHAGEKWADESENVSLNHTDLDATDKAAPIAVTNLAMSPYMGPTSTTHTAKWDASLDTGTTYNYYVESKDNNYTLLKTTKEETDSVGLTSGVKGYYYYVGNKAVKIVKETHTHSDECRADCTGVLSYTIKSQTLQSCGCYRGVATITCSVCSIYKYQQYFFYIPGSTGKLCSSHSGSQTISNIVSITGTPHKNVDGYVCGREATSNAVVFSECDFTETNSANIAVSQTKDTYISVAPVDNAGNIGPTESASSRAWGVVLYKVVRKVPYADGYQEIQLFMGQNYSPIGSNYFIPNPKGNSKYAADLEDYELVDVTLKKGSGSNNSIMDSFSFSEPIVYESAVKYEFTLYYETKEYPVKILDVTKDGYVLGETDTTGRLGRVVNGSSLGTNTTINYYYPNYKYVSSKSCTVSKDKANIAYRYFEGLNYNISYQLNGGEEVLENPTKVEFGEEFTVTPPKKDGFEFVKWKISGMSSTYHTINGTIVPPPTSTTYEVFGNHELGTAGTSPSKFMNLSENGGTVQFYAVWQDTTKPEVEKVLTKEDGTLYEEDTWTNQSVTMETTASDQSGISKYSIKQTSPAASTLVEKQPNTSPVEADVVFDETGTYEGTITATDKAGVVNDYTIVNPNGNLSTTVNFGKIMIDKVSPEGTISYNPRTPTNKSVEVSIENAKDLHSGLDTLPYSWDGGVLWVVKDSITVEDNGSGTVMIRDKAGNIVTLEWKVDWMDKVSPQISVKEVKNGNEYSSTLGGKVEENTTIKKFDTNSWYRNASYSWTNKDIEKDGYVASGIKSVLLQKGSDASFSTVSAISSNVLQKPTSLGETAVLNSAIENEGRNYFRVVTKDAVGNTTTASYQVNIDKTGVSISDGMSSISIGSLDTLTGEEIQYNLENGIPFTSEFSFYLYDATQADKQSNGLPATSDSSGIRGVYMYLYDAEEESVVNPYLTANLQGVNYTLSETEEMQNLANLLETSKGNLFNLTDSKTATVQTVSGSGIYSGYYSAIIDTYATYPESPALRYALVCYDNAGNRSVYTMPTGAVIENFSIKANIYSSVGEEYNTPSEDGATNIPYFKTGDMGHVDIWTLGYVEGVSFDFLEVGKESANAITRGDLLAKYNLGCDISGYERTISADKSVQIENGMPIIGGLSYANHYMYTVDGWLTEGTLVRIPPTYDLKVDAGRIDDDGDETYIYQTHNAKITAIKGDFEVTVFAPYVLYSTSREGIHYRTTHEYGQ